MNRLAGLTAVFLAAAALAGCYTGELPLEKRFIKDCNIRTFSEGNNIYMRISGECGMPMGVSRSTRKIDRNILCLDLIVSEDNRGARSIDEQFIIPGFVTEVELGGEVVWSRRAAESRKTGDTWDN